MPFFGDQFFWGRTVRDLGVGYVEPHANLSAARLAEAQPKPAAALSALAAAYGDSDDDDDA